MKRPEIKTIQNLEAAFAGESMAHIKYRYFAKIARQAGDEETARHFEETANQEVAHAFGQNRQAAIECLALPDLLWD